MGQLIVIVALFALLWLLLIRPARRRQVAQQELLARVSVDDEILTAGGLYGYVRELSDDELLLEVAPAVRVRMSRRAVAAVIPPEEDVADAEIADDEGEGDGEEGSRSANPNETNRG